METKRCGRCGQEKAIRHFHKDRNRPDGRYYCCKQCRRPLQARASRKIARRKVEYERAYRAENAGYLNAAARRRYWADPETARELANIRVRRSRERRREAARAAPE